MTRPRLRVVAGGAKRPGPVDAKRWITAVVSDRTLSVATRVVAAYIGSLHNPGKGYAYPSAKRIAHDTGLSLRAVWYAVDHLGKRQWLLINRGGGRGHANTYQINFETVQPDAPFNEPDEPETVQPDAPFDGEKGCKRRQERVQNDPDKGCNPVHPNKKDSNVEDSNWSPRAGRASAPSAPLAPPGTQRATQKGDPSDQEDEPSAREPAPDARADGGLAVGSPPPAQSGQDRESMLRDIAAAGFDGWNDLQYPAWGPLPPIHPAKPPYSKHQTVEEVCAAWCDALDHADTITRERALSLELYRACGADRAQKILEKASQVASRSSRPNYVAKALRNHKSAKAKVKHNGSGWHPDDALVEIHDMMIGAVVPKKTIRRLIKAVGPDRAIEIGEEAAKIDDESSIRAMVWTAITEGEDT